MYALHVDALNRINRSHARPILQPLLETPERAFAAARHYFDTTVGQIDGMTLQTE